MTESHASPTATTASTPPQRYMPMSRLLAMAIGVRLFNDTGIQIFGPFLATIASGLGVSIVALGALNSVRSMMGLAAPLLGSLADAAGYRTTMRALLLCAAAGSLVFAWSPNLWVAVSGLVLLGIGGLSFVPVLQAYVSAQVPYARRSRALGVLEYGWALAGIVGLSASGILIDRFSWRAPFAVMGGGLFVAFFLFALLPATPGSHSRSAARAAALQWRQWPARALELMRLESNARSAWVAILVNALNVFASSTVGIVYGVWLMGEYDLTTTQLGIVALALGVAELTGSVLVSLLGDRFGKYRSILASSVFSVAAYLLLPYLNIHALSVIAGLLFARFLFEVSIVSNISLLSEQVPSQRGKVLTLATASVTSAFAIASIVGPLTYSRWGIWGPALVAAVAALLAAILMVRWVSERQSAPSRP